MGNLTFALAAANGAGLSLVPGEGVQVLAAPKSLAQVSPAMLACTTVFLISLAMFGM